MAPLELNPYERIPRDKPQTGGLPWRLFSFALFLLILACAAYFGLKFGYSPLLLNRVEQLDVDIEELSGLIPEAERAGFVQLYSQIANLQSVLGRHVMLASLFPILERNTHTGVSFSSFDLSIPESRLAIEGSARSYEVLAQQLGALEQVPQVEKAYVAESQLAEGQVRFRIVIQFTPSLFKANQGAN